MMIFCAMWYGSILFYTKHYKYINIIQIRANAGTRIIYDPQAAHAYINIIIQTLFRFKKLSKKLYDVIAW